jgi:hypothetical protein
VTTLTSVLLPGAPADPMLQLGPVPGAAATCRHCGGPLVAEAELGWRHDRLSTEGWVCVGDAELAEPLPHTITLPAGRHHLV